MLFLVICLMVIGCWKKQSHEITTPNTPHYQLTGFIRDIDTQEPIENAEVIIYSVQQIYAVDWSPLTIFTDSTGVFVVDTIYPGSYTANVYQGDLEVASKPLMVVYADKEIEIDIPQVFITDGYVLTERHKIKFITWVGSTLWGRNKQNLNLNRIQSQSFNVDTLMSFRLSNNHFHSDEIVLDSSTDVRGLTSVYGNVYIYASDHINVLQLPAATINSTIPLDQFITSLVYSGGLFYSTLFGSIQVRGNQVNQVLSSVETNTGALSSLVKKGNYFWAYDRSRDFLLKIADDGNVVKTFKLFSDLDSHHIVVKSMALDGLQRLWICHNLNYYGNEYFSFVNLN